MKVAQRVIVLFKDLHGFGAAIFHALRPNPNSDLQSREESFDLSLEKYGIKDLKASGQIVHFQAHTGLYEVSVLLLENYEPPILACALSEVLSVLAAGESSTIPTVVVPFIVPATKLKVDSKSSAIMDHALTYGLQFGPSTDATQALVSKLHTPPPSLQIFHEQLACLLQLVRVLMLPTVVLIRKTESIHSQTSDKQLEAIYEIGEYLASFSSLCLSRERITLDPTKMCRETEEPWRALYG
nr:Glycerol-3-phosphate acyltransferase [Ipomoea batatas]